MLLRTAIGQTIRQLRDERGLVMRDLEFISNAHLSSIEQGNKNASSEMLEHIAEALDVTPVELLRKVCETLERGEQWR